jgi:Spy/CpxP family protein refolding chaperone
MTPRHVASLATLAILAGLALTGAAQEPATQSPPGLPPYFDKLGLSEEQKAHILADRKELRPKIEEARRQLREVRRSDRQKADEQRRHLRALERQERQDTEKHLTEAQRARLGELIQAARDAKGKPPGGGGAKP